MSVCDHEFGARCRMCFSFVILLLRCRHIEIKGMGLYKPGDFLDECGGERDGQGVE